jgi:hypothetical protein
MYSKKKEKKHKTQKQKGRKKNKPLLRNRAAMIETEQAIEKKDGELKEKKKEHSKTKEQSSDGELEEKK